MVVKTNPFGLMLVNGITQVSADKGAAGYCDMEISEYKFQSILDTRKCQKITFWSNRFVLFFPVKASQLYLACTFGN